MQTLNSADSQWGACLKDIMLRGELSAPRGFGIREILGDTRVISMAMPVVTDPTRKLSYKFMAAEAWWMLSGRNDLESIGQYNKNIHRFSDNGQRFFGAYGPPMLDQLDYVLAALQTDQDTRQAVMTFWRQNPAASKDIPCTVAMQFLIRNDRLHCVVTMRSNDVWLGFPYDVFNFSMISAFILTYLRTMGVGFQLGNLILTAGSRHVYDTNAEAAAHVLTMREGPLPRREYRPIQLEPSWTPSSLISGLKWLADGRTGERHGGVQTQLGAIWDVVSPRPCQV